MSRINSSAGCGARSNVVPVDHRAAGLQAPQADEPVMGVARVSVTVRWRLTPDDYSLKNRIRLFTSVFTER